MVSRASITAECADRQGEFWEMKDKLYNDPVKNITRYVKYADEIGMDTVRFKEDFEEQDTYDMISDDIDILTNKGLFATPAIVVGKRMCFNVRTEKELSEHIERYFKKQVELCYYFLWSVKSAIA